jgi:hypothetical protein
MSTLKKVPEVNTLINTYWKFVYDSKVIQYKVAKTYLHGIVIGLMIGDVITANEANELNRYIEQVFSL